MSRTRSRILRLIGGLVLLALLAVGGGTLWLRGSLPRLDGTLRLAGLEAAVEILRDDDGIVTIRAENERDAAFALGFAHAQDRLWQMDFMRRSGAGRVSEVLGPSTKRLDRFMRTLGLYRVAEANFEGLSAPLRATLEAYAAGVNAFIADRGGPLPLEFQLLRYAPEPWRPADSLIWGRLMALQLSDNWTQELLRARLAKHLEPERIAFLWPDYPGGAPVTLPDLAALEGARLRELAGILPWELAPKDASNSWVVTGALTTTGHPILANDPHLAMSAPGVWYLARIETPELTLAGATAPGVPFMILGHNGRIAWGFTTTHSDVQDLFLERLDPDDPDRYLAPGGALPFITREETIEVRGEEAERVRIRATRHGPVLSDAVPQAAGAAGSKSVLALSWPALRPDDRTAEALYAMNRATDWESFRAALRDFHSPQQNIAYADVDGNIGFVAPARVPLRRAGDGRAPVPGWSGAHDWTGFIPFEELPAVLNPSAGRIVAANNKIVPDGYPHLLTADWKDPFRAARITQILAEDAARRGSLEGARAIQLDIESLGVRSLLPLLRRARPETDRGREAVDLLVDWNGRMERDSAAPLIFYAWMRELNRTLLADELGENFLDFQHPKAALLARVLTDGQVWCDDVTSAEVEDCPSRMNAALEVALNHLALRFGKAIPQLRWGDAHIARFSHPVLDRVPLLRWLFGYSVETDGGSYTINRAGVRFNGPKEDLFEDIHGPGYRAVYDLSNLDNSRFMIATGQSGNPFSPHYGDLATRWRDGHYLYLVGNGTVSGGRLRLTPE